MTWGPYWMFYRCPACGRKFKHALGDTDDTRFGICPACDAKGEFVGESKNPPADAASYETG